MKLVLVGSYNTSITRGGEMEKKENQEKRKRSERASDTY
jgi:hypothetical protein